MAPSRHSAQSGRESESPDPIRAEVARSSYVVLACPLKKKVFIDFFAAHRATSLEVYDSLTWAGSRACIAVATEVELKGSRMALGVKALQRIVYVDRSDHH